MKPDWKELCALATHEIEAILAELPIELRKRAVELPVTFEPHPNDDLQAEGIDFDVLGLFVGPEYAEEGAVPMPPQIILFLDNLWEEAKGDQKVCLEEIRTTFLHELGHYFGLDEDDLRARGLE